MIKLKNLITEANKTKLFDQGKINAILADIKKITKIKKSSFSEISYEESTWGDDLINIEFFWQQDNATKWGKLKLEVDEDGNWGWGVMTQYGDARYRTRSPIYGFEDRDVKLNATGANDISSVDLDMIWKKSKPILKKIDNDVEKWINTMIPNPDKY